MREPNVVGRRNPSRTHRLIGAVSALGASFAASTGAGVPQRLAAPVHACIHDGRARPERGRPRTRRYSRTR